MRRFAGLILILLVILFGLTFALLNAAPVELDYYFGALSAPLSLVLIVTVILGAVLGVLASIGVVVGKQREVSRLRRQARNAEKELQELRRLPLKESL